MFKKTADLVEEGTPNRGGCSKVGRHKAQQGSGVLPRKSGCELGELCTLLLTTAAVHCERKLRLLHLQKALHVTLTDTSAQTMHTLLFGAPQSFLLCLCGFAVQVELHMDSRATSGQTIKTKLRQSIAEKVAQKIVQQK